MILNKFLGNSFSFKLTSVRNGDTLFIEEVDNRVSVILDPGHGGHDVGAEFGSIFENI